MMKKIKMYLHFIPEAIGIPDNELIADMRLDNGSKVNHSISENDENWKELECPRPEDI